MIDRSVESHQRWGDIWCNFSGWLLRPKRLFVCCTVSSIYICCFSPSFLLFANIFQCQRATVTCRNLLFRLLSASIHHAVSVPFLHRTTVSALRPIHVFFLFLFSLCIVCPSHIQTCRVLGVYPSRVGVIDV